MIEITRKQSTCPLAKGLEILGDKWTLLIIRDLMFTNRQEFGHFRDAGEGIATNILSERLERLQCYGLISKSPHPSHGKKFIYSLTDEGKKLTPTIIEFTLWASNAIDNTFVPPVVLNMMKTNPKGLIERVKSGPPLINLDFNSSV